jgi:hypothetical protein
VYDEQPVLTTLSTDSQVPGSERNNLWTVSVLEIPTPEVGGLLPDNSPNQHLCFQDCAIGQIQPKGRAPDPLILGVGHEEINRIA